jgi:phosphotransferase system HPr-like phosphotransfer protein
MDSETIKNYKEQTPKNRGLDSLIKFANAKDTDVENVTDANEENESESSIKVEPLQIKVGKDNKITIKGKASKEVLTLLIEELKKMMA